jgi:hypothetical protein
MAKSETRLIQTGFLATAQPFIQKLSVTYHGSYLLLFRALW